MLAKFKDPAGHFKEFISSSLNYPGHRRRAMQNLSGGNGISFAFYKSKSANFLNKDIRLFSFVFLWFFFLHF